MAAQHHLADMEVSIDHRNAREELNETATFLLLKQEILAAEGVAASSRSAGSVFFPRMLHGCSMLGLVMGRQPKVGIEKSAVRALRLMRRTFISSAAVAGNQFKSLYSGVDKPISTKHNSHYETNGTILLASSSPSPLLRVLTQGV